MTQNLQEILALANQEAESGIDMNEAVKGGGGARLLPEGYAFAQLVEYIEYGMQPQEFGGKAKDPAMEFSLGFALTGQGYQNDDGTPYIIRPYSMALSRNEKARAFLLFKLLNYKGTAKNFGQLLTQKWLVKVVNVPRTKQDSTLVSRLDLTSFLPPFDPVTKAPYPIPDAPAEMYRLFLWNRPTKQAWDALYIEGMYEAKDGKPAASKNRLQETCLAALDFSGSPLEQLLLASNVSTLPQAKPATAATVAPAVPSTPVQAPSGPVVAPAVPAAPVVASAPAVPATAPLGGPSGIAAPAVPVAPVVPSTPALPA